LAKNRCVNGCSASPTTLITFKENLSSDISVRESLDLLELEGMLPEQWPALCSESFPTSNPLLISSSALPAQLLVKDKVQDRTAVGAGNIAGDEEEIGDDEAMGDSFREDGPAAMEKRDTGDWIKGQEVVGNKAGAEDSEMGEEGMDIEDVVGAKKKAGDEEEMDIEGVMGDIAEEGTDTGDLIKGWEAVGNKVARDDVDEMTEEGMDTEDGTEDMTDDEEEIGDEGEMGETSETDADAGMEEGTDTLTGPTLRPRQDAHLDFKLQGPHKPGFKGDGPCKFDSLRESKKNMQDNASSLPGSYTLPIDLDVWTCPEPDIHLCELKAPNLVSFLSHLLIVLLHQ
jgi:hypothetical protein